MKLNERIRVLSLETVRAMKMEGSTNDTIERIKGDEFFGQSTSVEHGFASKNGSTAFLHRSLFGTSSIPLLDPKLLIGRSAEICRGIWWT